MLTIGVDIGGTKLSAGVVDEAGTVLARTRRDTPASDVEAIEVAAADAVAELRRDHDVAAVGVAAAGFVDAARSTVVFAPNLAWRDEPMEADLERRIGLPVVIENDANAAAWGEFAFGGGQGCRDMLLLTVGTGLGGGIVLDGQLIRGKWGFAAELGHLRVVPDGIPCGCGQHGCWEQYASGTALVRRAREVAASGEPRAARLLALAGGDPLELEGVMVSAAAQEGDPAAVALLSELGGWLGQGIAGMAAVLDPEVVVVGGGVSEIGDLLLAPAREAFAEHLTAGAHRPHLQLRAATLGNDAGMIGVADQARRA